MKITFGADMALINPTGLLHKISITSDVTDHVTFPVCVFFFLDYLAGLSKEVIVQ